MFKDANEDISKFVGGIIKPHEFDKWPITQFGGKSIKGVGWFLEGMFQEWDSWIYNWSGNRPFRRLGSISTDIGNKISFALPVIAPLAVSYEMFRIARGTDLGFLRGTSLFNYDMAKSRPERFIAGELGGITGATAAGYLTFGNPWAIAGGRKLGQEAGYKLYDDPAKELGFRETKLQYKGSMGERTLKYGFKIISDVATESGAHPSREGRLEKAVIQAASSVKKGFTGLTKIDNPFRRY